MMSLSEMHNMVTCAYSHMVGLITAYIQVIHVRENVALCIDIDYM